MSRKLPHSIDEILLIVNYYKQTGETNEQDKFNSQKEVLNNL